MDKFQVVEFKFDGTGKSESRPIKNNLSEKMARAMATKLNEERPIDDDRTIVAYAACKEVS